MLARAAKEQERRQGDKEGFTSSPGDCLAYKYHRDVCPEAPFPSTLPNINIVSHAVWWYCWPHLDASCQEALRTSACWRQQLTSARPWQAVESRSEDQRKQFVQKGIAVADSESARATLVTPSCSETPLEPGLQALFGTKQLLSGGPDTLTLCRGVWVRRSQKPSGLPSSRGPCWRPSA